MRWVCSLSLCSSAGRAPTGTSTPAHCRRPDQPVWVAFRGGLCWRWGGHACGVGSVARHTGSTRVWLALPEKQNRSLLRHRGENSHVLAFLLGTGGTRVPRKLAAVLAPLSCCRCFRVIYGCLNFSSGLFFYSSGNFVCWNNKLPTSRASATILSSSGPKHRSTKRSELASKNTLTSWKLSP